MTDRMPVESAGAAPGASVALATSSSDYDATYYHSGLGPPYKAGEEHWARFFGSVADVLVGGLAPATALDAGCAKGFLVKALVERGVDAKGVDVSEYAIATAEPVLADRLAVHDLTAPLPGRYDLITCIEVLEHMAPASAEVAIANLCAATGVVVLSSTPHDFAEPTHVNLRRPADWAASFARHGFFRKPSLDLSVLAPWAVCFERRPLDTVDLVHLYEGLHAFTREEALGKTAALLETERRLSQLLGEVPVPGGPGQLDRVLGLLDEVMGLRAELASARSDAAAALDRLQRESLHRPAEWAEGQERAALETSLAREREVRHALERRVRGLELQVRAFEAQTQADADLARSRSFRAARLAARVARRARR